MTVYKEDVQVYVDEETKGVNFMMYKSAIGWILKYQFTPLRVGTLQECKAYSLRQCIGLIRSM